MRPQSAKKVLVVAAHPDDEVLGCGAVVAKHAAQGARVWILILGEGIAARKRLSVGARSRRIRALHSCARRAGAVLGCEKLILRSFPDNRLDAVPRLDLIHAIESVTWDLAPDTVYTHTPCDLNIDHQIVSEAVRTACRPLPGSPVRRVLAFEIPSSTEWRFDAARQFQPNVFMDITGFLELKIKALAVYRGEARSFPHPRSAEYVRALARVRGGQSGLRAAEAFSLIRGVEP